MKKDAMKERHLVTGDYPVLEPSFIHEVKATRKQDPFNPLLVLVSSKLLGLHLRRLLSENDLPHFNLRFLTLEEFARGISTPQFLSQGKKELPPHADELIIANIAKSLAGGDEEFYFHDIVDRPGFHRAILSTLKDLKDACLLPEKIGRSLRDTKISKQVHLPKLKDLLKLWKGYQEQLEGLNCYDESDLMISASQWAKDSIYLKQTIKMLIYGFYDFNAAQKRLLKACFVEKETIAFLPYEHTYAFEFVKPALKWFKGLKFKETCIERSVLQTRSPSLDHFCLHLFNDGKPLENPSNEIQILSAPGEPREVREVIRMALQKSQKDETPSHEIGIVLRSPEEYSRLFREAFDSLGIEPYLREGLPFIKMRAGRSIMLLLNITTRNFSRQSVMEFATFAKLRAAQFSSEGDYLLNLPRWDAISIQAGIVEGQKEWDERLQRLRESWGGKGEAEEEGEGKRRFHREDLIALDQLIPFIQKLFVSLRLLAGASTWHTKVTALLNAFDGFVEQDEEGLLIKQAMRRLSELDMIGIPPTPRDFSRLVDEVLQREVIPNGRFQRNGPTIVNLMAVRGVPFKMVIVPGMVEKSFPPLMRQDAILLDQERKVLNRSLAGKEGEPLPMKAEGRLDEERLLFRLAIGAATEKLILSFPRIEIGTGRERLPSSFILASIKALTGKSVDFNQLERFQGFVRIPLSEIAVKSPEEALDEVEFDLSTGQEKLGAREPQTLLYLREVSPFFGRGLQLEFSRWGRRVFTAYEGILTSKEALQILRERYSIFKKSISPTRLEDYAICPYQYLLNVIMGIEALTEPEREPTITPLDKGKLVHDILWEFFTDLRKERSSPFRLKLEDSERLLDLARKKFVEFEKVGVTGYPMLWEVEKKDMLEILIDFFNEELKETEFIPTYFEVRYGMKRHGFQESEISTEDPVPLKVAGKTINLRGRIDRIDLTKDGKRARVRDYKTGKVSAKTNDFQGGRTLQLPLYLYAAQQLLGRLHKGIQVESAEYYSLKDQKPIPFNGSELDERESELQEILQTIAEAIEEGIFIPFPHEQSCKYQYCDFRFICGSWSQALFNRKSGDPRIRRYFEMVTEEAKEGGE